MFLVKNMILKRINRIDHESFYIGITFGVFLGFSLVYFYSLIFSPKHKRKFLKVIYYFLKFTKKQILGN